MKTITIIMIAVIILLACWAAWYLNSVPAFVALFIAAIGIGYVTSMTNGAPTK